MGNARFRTKIILAFGAVYLIWGSTYLAIRYAIDTMPPLMMAGARFTIAGAILYLWSQFRNPERVGMKQWRSASIIGILLFVGGNGGLTWAEQFVPTGLAALLLATIPLWMVVLDSLRRESAPITKRVIVGLILGLIGVLLLITPGKLLGNGHVDALGAAVLLIGSITWAAGSLYSRRAPLPKSTLLSAGMQMFTGGIGLLLAGLIGGEASQIRVTEISVLSAASFLYLLVFGSLIGFTAYTWLLGATTPARASTYAYVNPLVAVALGWAVGGETVTGRVVLAAAIIISAVIAIISRSKVPLGDKVISRDDSSEIAPNTCNCA